MRYATLILTCFLAASASTTVVAQTIDVEVDGNELTADISLAGGIGAELILQFDNAFGLTTSSAGISASLVNPTDPALLARLPSLDTLVPTAFPMLITVEPPLTGGLGFTDTVLVEIHTHQLSLTANTPFRLFKAPLGGDFVDITETVGAGSIRSRGRTGGFSQFLIISDLRDHDTVIEQKLDDLDAYLLSLGLSQSLETALQDDLDAARADFEQQEYIDAEEHLDDFIDAVEDGAGSTIPNIWRAARDLENGAGNLIGKASSARFSLRMANSLLN